MTNPTSNFGWQMPTNTDLVYQLPADFEVFGQAVDTSLADLKGGTSGQVLAKNSNTDMDFVWVAQDDSNAIQNAIVDAKGDLIAATAADTPARLAVGTDGQVLTADSTAATGLKWAAASAGGTWTTWTPSYTNLTIGNGTVVARYTQTGKTVTLFWRLTFGSTTSITGTAPTVSLPATAAYTNIAYPIGFLLNAGVEAFVPLAQITSSTAFTLRVARTDQTYLIDNNISSTVPFTWGTSDEMTYTFTYEAA